MLVKYIDSNYIIETLQKPSWGEVEEPDFYITMASNRVKALIFPSEQGDPNNLESYNEEQQEAIKLATAIYTLWYFDTNYDFTNGSISVNFGGVSMSESKTYNGEMVLPNVFDILKQANLIPTTETFIFNNTSGSFDNININPEAFKDLQQEMERQADNNIRQDGEIVKIYDRLSRVPTNEEQEHLKLEVEEIQKEQEVQNTNIQANTNNIQGLNNTITEHTTDIAQIKQEQEEQNNNITSNTNQITQIKAEINVIDGKVDTTYDEVVDLMNKIPNIENKIQLNTNAIKTNETNITLLDSRLLIVSGLLNQTIDGLRTLRPFKFVGLYDPLRDYMVNEMVSKDNIFYLSLEDNNRTTPPNDKWLVMKDFQQVDLSEYPTKLEVDSIKNDLQNKITTNTTNITALTNRTNTIEQNYVSKTTTTPQTIASQITFTQTDMVLKFNSGTNNSAYLAGFKSNNQRVWYFGKGSSTSDNFIIGADRGVIKLEPSTHVDVSNKKIINVATPTAINDAVNKQYVDNAIANAAPTDLVNRIQSLETNTVKLTGDQRVEGNKVFTNAEILLGNLINIGPTQSSLVNKGYVDDAIANAAGTGGAGLENRIQVLENKVDATYDEFIDLANITIPRIEQKNQIQQNAIDSHDRKITQNTQNISNLQTLTTTNRDKIAYLETNTVNTSTNQTINGTKAFAMKILANGGITNLTTPTDIQDAANKFYVDNRTGLDTIYSSTTIYNNLNKITTNIFNNSNVDYNKPLTVSFTRTNNSGTDYGSYTFQIQYGIGENNFVVGSNLYYDRSKTYGQLGDYVALTITPTYIQVQCWNGGDRIKNIKVQGWKKV